MGFLNQIKYMIRNLFVLTIHVIHETDWTLPLGLGISLGYLVAWTAYILLVDPQIEQTGRIVVLGLLGIPVVIALWHLAGKFTSGPNRNYPASRR